MRIVIDAQALQSARLEPKPRETLLAFLTALADDLAWHEVFLLLNGQRGRVAAIREAFRKRLRASEVRLWYAVEPIGIGHDRVGWQHEAARLAREAAIASIDPDLVIAAFCLDGSALDAVFSAGQLCAVPTLAYLSPTSQLTLSHERFAVDNLAQQLRQATGVVATASSGPKVGLVGEERQDLLVTVDGPAEARAWLSQQAELTSMRLPPEPAQKPRLAYVSPLPPERSGISFYSAELLPSLARHYDIDVIVKQAPAESPQSLPYGVKDAKWFAAHAGAYDRIVYHFGNSVFHRHMFELIDQHPGVVVLHDFFLSGVVADMDTSGYAPGAWVRELYESHGYRAASERFLDKQHAEVAWRYPCSGSVLARASGVIVHSESTRALVRQWHGADAARRTSVIPHMRAATAQSDRLAARRTLGLGAEDFVVCAFGGMGPTKLNRRLVDAWLASKLAADARCTLIFVGAPEGGAYGRDLAQRLAGAEGSRIGITGWVDEERFQLYLAAADLAVQLRALSRGETSGTVLDCMNAGVPLIVNAHGSMADLPAQAVWLLPDAFEDSALTEAIETLHDDRDRSTQLAQRAREHIRDKHNPDKIAALYALAIETFAARPRMGLGRLAKPLAAAAAKDRQGIAAYEAVATSTALSLSPPFAARQLLVDVSAIARTDLRTGIERAVRALLRELIATQTPTLRIEPVWVEDRTLRYARQFTMKFLGAETRHLHDEPVEFHAGDIYFMPDLDHDSVIRNRDTYRAMRDHGVSVNFMVHDLLPVTMPQYFPPQAAAMHEAWLKVVNEADRAVCVSRTVAQEFADWQAGQETANARIWHSHHGADLAASHPTNGQPRGARRMLEQIAAAKTFLMVGTVEPRKGHADALDAFEALWAKGSQAHLVVVGKPGWMVDGLVDRLDKHPETGKRLTWIRQASDEFLERIYAASSCLLAASHGEGFGLPLVEASTHGLPVIARDIPVFREVAGDSALYFNATRPGALAATIEEWLKLDAEGKAPASSGMRRLTWAESARNLLALLMEDWG